MDIRFFVFIVYGQNLTLSFDSSIVPAPDIFRALCTELERRLEADPKQLIPNLPVFFDHMSSFAQTTLETKLMDLMKTVRTIGCEKGVSSPFFSPEVQKVLQESFTTKEITVSIRRFLRELPEPLIPTNVYDDFIDMGKSQIDSDAILMMDKLITNSLNTHHSRYEYEIVKILKL